MGYEVRVEHVESGTTAVVRCRARPDELAEVVPRLCGEVWEYARATALPRPGRHLAVYLDDQGNIEVGVELAQPFVGNDRVVCSSTPAGAVVTTAHLGPYHRLGDAHEAIRRWCADHGHALTGTSW